VPPIGFPPTNPLRSARRSAHRGSDSAPQIQWAAVAAAHEVAFKKSNKEHQILVFYDMLKLNRKLA